MQNRLDGRSRITARSRFEKSCRNCLQTWGVVLEPDSSREGGAQARKAERVFNESGGFEKRLAIQQSLLVLSGVFSG